MLTEAQIAEYHEKGYVVPDYRLPEAELEEIRNRHSTRCWNAIPEFRDNASALLLSHDLGFLNYARDPEILDMVEQLIGPDICLWNMSFFAKPAHERQEDALAPGWPVLADPATGDLHGLDRD